MGTMQRRVSYQVKARRETSRVPSERRETSFNQKGQRLPTQEASKAANIILRPLYDTYSITYPKTLL